jgi:hypothetical protein
MIDSQIECVSKVEFPNPSGLRIMMMPFRLEEKLPELCAQYQAIVDLALLKTPTKTGIAYLTIDEAPVRKDEYHRRPGLHVDGIVGSWGGDDKGGWGAGGMFVAASHHGCEAWRGVLEAAVGHDGSCEHLRPRLEEMEHVKMEAGVLYHVSPGCIHQAKPAGYNQTRQFFRLSMPSDAAWFEGYTPSPLGVAPTGPILPRRVEQMSWRA